MGRRSSVRIGRLCGAAVTLLLFAAAHLLAADLPTVRAVFIQSGSKVVRALSLQTGATQASAELETVPDDIYASPDGSRIVIQSLSFFGLVRNLHLLDSRTLATVAIVPIGGDVADKGFWSLDSKRLTLLVSRNKSSHELVQIATSDGKTVARLPVPPASSIPSWELFQPGKLVLLAYEGSGRGPSPYHLALVDLQDLSATRQLTLPGDREDLSPWKDVSVLPDRNLLYLVGLTADRKDYHGALRIVSLNPLSLIKTVKEAGSYTSSVIDNVTKHVLVGATGDKGNESYLLDYDGAEEKHRLKLSDMPRYIVLPQESRRAYVVCFDSIQVVDLDAFVPIGAIPLGGIRKGRKPSQVLQDDMFVLAKGEEKGYLLPLAPSPTLDRIWKVDLRSFALVNSLPFKGGITMAIVNPGPPVLFGNNGKTLYVLGSGRVHAIDEATFSESGSPEVSWADSLGTLVPDHTPPLLLTSKAGIQRLECEMFDVADNKKILDGRSHFDLKFIKEGRYALEWDEQGGRFAASVAGRAVEGPNAMVLRDGKTFEVLKRTEGLGHESMKTHITRVVWVLD